MKVFVVSTLYSPNEIGGAEITARAVAEGLTARGHEVVTASIAPDGNACEREINNVRCYYLKLANIYWPHTPGFKPALWQKLLWHTIDAFNPVMALRLGRLLDREKPDVVHMHNLQGFSVSAWWAARRRKISIVQTLHDYYLACPNSVMYRNGVNCTAPCLECRVFGVPRRLLSHMPSAVTGVSRRMLTRLENRGLFAKVKYKSIIYGCNFDTPAVEPRMDKPPGSVVTFGFFGRIEPLKGLEVALEAMRKLPQGKARLLIGGRGAPEYITKLEQKYGAPDVAFLGFTKPSDFFQAIDVLIVPSLWEDPFPRVAHEAFSYGVPVYAARLGGLPEAVENDTGELFPAGDSEALAALMLKTIDQGLPSRALFAVTRLKAQKYALAPILDQYEQALMNVVD